MKSQKLVTALTILALFFLMSSCTQEDSFENEVLDKVNVSGENFRILPLTDNQVRNAKYTANYQVEIESSEFNINNDKIALEIPIPLNDFSFLKAYNVSTSDNVAILYVIQREKQNVVVDLPTNFVIQDQLTLSELNIDTALLAEKGCLRVYVMNNSKEDLLNDETKIVDCLKKTLNDFTCEDKYATPESCDFTANGQNKKPGIIGGGILM